MGYLKDVEAWLTERGITDGEVRRAIKEKILESYRNGQKECIRRFGAVLKEEGDAVKREVEAKLAKHEQPPKPRA